MTYSPKGKLVSIDRNAPEALGICDYTKFVHMHKDLVKQMEWRGNALVWTGFYVGKSYADVPNAQLKTPILPPDPVPVRNPRLQQPTVITWSGNYNNSWSTLPVFSWNSWEGTQNAIPAVPETQRLSLLEAGGIFGAPSISTGTIFEPELTQAQVLQQLQQFQWNQV